MRSALFHPRAIVATAFLGALWLTAEPAQAVLVTQLELTGGRVQLDFGFFGPLRGSFEREGLLVMGQYQPLPDIFPPITKGHRTLTLFTSGIQGAPPPSGTVSGSMITVDLTSLFLGISRGDRLRAWNIGGIANGSFDPSTSAFSMSWEHLFRGQPLLSSAVFSLQGTAVLAPIPLPASLVLFASGLVGIGQTIRRRGKGLISPQRMG